MVVCSNDNSLDLLRAVRAGELQDLRPADLQPLAQQGLVAIVPKNFLQRFDFLDVFGEHVHFQLERLKHALQVRTRVAVLGPLIYPDEPQIFEAQISTYSNISSNLGDYPEDLSEYREFGDIAVALTRKARLLLGEPVDLREEEFSGQDNWRRLSGEAEPICKAFQNALVKIYSELEKAEERMLKRGHKGLDSYHLAVEHARGQISVLAYSVNSRPQDWGRTSFTTNFPELLKHFERDLEHLSKALTEIGLKKRAGLNVLRLMLGAVLEFGCRYENSCDRLENLRIVIPS